MKWTATTARVRGVIRARTSSGPKLRSCGPRLSQSTGVAPSWNGAGQRLVVKHLGSAAVAALTECARSPDAARAQAAARLLDRVKRR